MKAVDLMTEGVSTLRDDATIADVIAMVTELEIRHVPLVDQDGVLTGVLSDRDLRMIDGLMAQSIGQDAQHGKNVLAAPATSLVGGAPISCREDTSVDDIIDILVGERVGAVIVVDGALRVVGIVSTVDVLAAARGQLG